MRLKHFAIPASLLVIKALTVARTGIDTYRVTGDVLDVLLIDGVMAAFWLVAAYAGQSQQALAVRPFAAAGAWGLYLAQLYIGWEADHSPVAFIVRAAGGLALLYDTWGYVVVLFRARRQSSRSAADRRVALRRAVFAAAYAVMTLALAPLALLTAGIHVLADMVRDTMASTQTAPSPTPPTVVDSVVVTPRRLPPAARRAALEKKLTAGPVGVEELAVEFGVTARTIRRDLGQIGVDVDKL